MSKLPKISQELFGQVCEEVATDKDYVINLVERLNKENPLVADMLCGMLQTNEQILEICGVDTLASDLLHNSSAATVCAVYDLLSRQADVNEQAVRELAAS